jgi:CheY-like chemotaxis protein
VAEAGSGEETVAQARQHHPDVVLMDLRMPGAGGLAAGGPRIRRAAPGRISNRPNVITCLSDG